MVDAFFAELRQSLRVFLRSPGFVAAVLGTLAVGIRGATSIFSLVKMRPRTARASPCR